jgi:hypothetical protein
MVSPCGHTPWCEDCGAKQKPKPKSCGVCGGPIRGAKYLLNKSLAYVIAELYPEQISAQEVELSKAEIEVREKLKALDAVLQQRGEEDHLATVGYKAYRSKAAALVHAGMDKLCACDLVMLPKHSVRRDRKFWSCAGWQACPPLDQDGKPKGQCNDFGGWLNTTHTKKLKELQPFNQNYNNMKHTKGANHRDALDNVETLHTLDTLDNVQEKSKLEATREIYKAI